MKAALLLIAFSLSISACSAVKRPPGQPAADSQVIPPSEITDFNVLYGQNWRGGPAIGLGDPIYLAIADDTTIHRVTSEGVPGTNMPAFAKSSGGMLTNAQIDAIVTGMRTRWSKPAFISALTPPPYTSHAAGDAKRGATVYADFCSSCHGADG